MVVHEYFYISCSSTWIANDIKYYLNDYETFGNSLVMGIPNALPNVKPPTLAFKRNYAARRFKTSYQGSERAIGI